MIVISLKDRPGFRAGDGSFLRELLHPARTSLAVGYSLAHAAVSPGRATRPHRLRSAEVYYVLEGRGLMHVGEETAMVAAGQAVYIPPGEIQFIENDGPNELLFLCIVDPAWTDDDEEIL